MLSCVQWESGIHHLSGAGIATDEVHCETFDYDQHHRAEIGIGTQATLNWGAHKVLVANALLN